MQDFFSAIDFEATIQDFEFTRRAMRKIRSVVDSEDFDDMDTAMIFHYLSEEMELVSFHDYLKRYLYERSGMKEPFRTIPDKTFQEIIMYSFEENHAPHSFTPTTNKWPATVKRWLTQDGVRRQVIFLLGFGLRMSETDVSDFLTKVLKEQDFDMTDPREVIFRYCYMHDYPYAKALSLLKIWDGMQQKPATSAGFAGIGRKKQAPVQSRQEDQGRLMIGSERDLLSYLQQLRTSNIKQLNQDKAYQYFLKLYDQSLEVVAAVYQMDEDEAGSGRIWTKDQIGASDLEKFICSGIPLTGSGNLQKMSSSVLSRHFQQRRMSRQRLDALKKRTQEVERFDLITLLFFLNSMPTDDEFPNHRCIRYIDEANRMLKDCGMSELYPVNGYEAFILMCLLTEYPLEAYCAVWEKSYEA